MAEATFKEIPEIFEVFPSPPHNRIYYNFFSRWNSGRPLQHELRVYVRTISTIFRFLTAYACYLATFRELGPPDLCHVVKSTGRSGQRDVSTHSMLRVMAL